MVSSRRGAFVLYEIIDVSLWHHFFLEINIYVGRFPLNQGIIYIHSKVLL